MRKSNILLSIIVIMALVLAGCSAAEEPTVEESPVEVPAAEEPEVVEEPADEEPVVDEEPAAEEEPVAEEEQEPVTLTFWHAGTNTPLPEVTLELADEFMDLYPWITVEVEVFPFGEYFTKVDVATAGGTAPDVLWVDVTEVPKYAYFDVILPLDEYLPDDYLDDWYSGPARDMQFEDSIWAIPLHQSTEALVYNKALVEAAGLEPPTSYADAWTLEEFRDALDAVTVTRDDGTTEVWGWMTNYSLSVYNFQPLIYAAGGTFMDDERTTYLGYLDSEETVAAAEWFAQLHIDGLAPVERVPDMFQTGQAAFLQTNPFALVDIVNRYPDLEVGVTPNPCGVRCAAPAGGWHIGISSQTEHPDEAWLFVDFMTNPEGHYKWVTGTGYMPARISVYEQMPELQEYPWNIFMEGLIEHAAHRPVTLAYQFFNTLMTPAIADMINGYDVRPILENVANQAQQELDTFQ